MGPDAMILVFWMLSFKLAFPLSSFTFTRGSLVPLHFLSLLLVLLAVLIPACASSSPAFHMMYSAYKLNKQSDNIHPWCASFPILNQSIVPCLVLTVASWPVYRFLRREVRLSGIPISLRIFQSMGSLRVGHDWATSLSLFTFMHWRRKWQPTPVFLTGESQGRRSLVGCRLWGRTESDTTEAT